MNRLAQEKSPYLRQHERNPVAWQPWDQQALQESKESNKPIFLSIGYSTCHWCHVMEHESFTDPEVARLLNDCFIPIKVDREERPDLDAIYMAAVQQMTGHGGWPLSIWLTPERQPFFGGTYFPRQHFCMILAKIREIWQQDEQRLRADASQMQYVLEQLYQAPAESVPFDEKLFETYLNHVEQVFDADNGGFGEAPKFPSALMLMTLQRLGTSHSGVQKWIVTTLDKMRRGGIYDHLKGGFHRYSTDASWQVPHFEKMLYDNALLAINYCEAKQVFGINDFQQVAQETLDFVLRDLQAPGGGFYSALDADSFNPTAKSKEEGYFATYDHKELTASLTSDELLRLEAVYGVTPEGNWEGRNILHLSDQQTGREKLNDPLVAAAFAKLNRLRDQRPAPHRDEKIIAEWNGLMIAALAKGWQVLGDRKYLQAAAQALQFCLQEMRLKDGTLYRHSCEGKACGQAFAEDYSAMIFALLAVYECDFNLEWLNQAIALQEILDRHYWDNSKGGYYRDAGQDKSLLLRVKDEYDGVTPSANSLASVNLLRLALLTGKERYNERAREIFSFCSDRLTRAPTSLSMMVQAVHFSLAQPAQVLFVYQHSREQLVERLKDVHQRFLPSVVLMAGEAGAPQVQGRQAALTGEFTAYICQAQTCQPPVTDVEELIRRLEQLKA